MKKIALGISLLFCSFGFSQSIKFKDGIVYIDEKEWSTYEGCSVIEPECSFLKGGHEISVMTNEYEDLSHVTENNAGGTVQWFDVKFLGTGKVFETWQNPRMLVKQLYRNKVFNNDGTFNMAGIDLLVEKYGQPYSERYNRMLQTRPTVIIKEEKPAK